MRTREKVSCCVVVVVVVVTPPQQANVYIGIYTYICMCRFLWWMRYKQRIVAIDRHSALATFSNSSSYVAPAKRRQQQQQHCDPIYRIACPLHVIWVSRPQGNCDGVCMPNLCNDADSQHVCTRARLKYHVSSSSRNSVVFGGCWWLLIFTLDPRQHVNTLLQRILRYRWG